MRCFSLALSIQLLRRLSRERCSTPDPIEKVTRGRVLRGSRALIERVPCCFLVVDLSSALMETQLPTETPRGRVRLVLGRLLAVSFAGYYWSVPVDLSSARSIAGIVTPHDLVFYALTLGLWMVWARPLLRALRDPLLMLVLAYAGWCVLGVLWTVGDAEHKGVEVLAWSASLVTFVLAVATLLRGRIAVVRLVVVVAATSQALVSLVSFALGRSFDGRLQGVSLVEHPNVFARCAGFAAVLALTRAVSPSVQPRVRALWFSASGVLVAAVALTGSRSAVLALVVTMAFLGLWPRLRFLSSATVLSLVVVFGILAEASFAARGDAGRSSIYSEVLESALERPLLGHGIGARDDVEVDPGSPAFLRGRTVHHTHNPFLGAFFHGGAVGLGLLVAILVMGGRRAWRDLTGGVDPGPASLLVFGVCAAFWNVSRPVFNPHDSVFLMLWLPLALLAPTVVAARAPTTEDEERLTCRGAGAPGVFDHIAGRWILAAGLVVVVVRLFSLATPFPRPASLLPAPTAFLVHSLPAYGLSMLERLGGLGDSLASLRDLARLSSHTSARATMILFLAAAAVLLTLWLREALPGRGPRLDGPRFQPEALLAGLFFVAGPLHLLSSTLVIVDALALFCAHLMVWASLRGVRGQSSRWMVLAGGASTLGVMIQAPMMLPSATLLTLLLARASRSHRRFVVTCWWSWLPGAGLLALWLGSLLEPSVEAGQSSRWTMVTDYVAFEDSWRWFAGSWQQRLEPETWLVFASSLASDVAGPVVLALACVGLGRVVLQRCFVVLAVVASAMSGLVVSYVGGVASHYGALTLLAPVAVLAALGFRSLLGELAGSRKLRMVPVALIVAVLLQQVVAAHWTQTETFASGAQVVDLVDDTTPPGGLVVTSWSAGNPLRAHLLGQARSRGWVVEWRDLTSDTLRFASDLGASHLVLVGTGDGSRLPPQMSSKLVRVERVSGAGGWVQVFALDSELIAQFPNLVPKT